jgi:four helix bundle protein
MSQSTNTKLFNLEDRLLVFSQNVITLCKQIKITVHNKNIISQLLKSSTSIGANYTEANDALGKKDFLHRLRISRKESKETIYWLKLLSVCESDFDLNLKVLIKECIEIRNILSAIINKSV